jgi:hypothetical protein
LSQAPVFQQPAKRQPSFVDFGIVSIVDCQELEDLTFLVSTIQVRVVINFLGSDFQIGGQQRKRWLTYAGARFLEVQFDNLPSTRLNETGLHSVF